jgi:hypothetical protein
VETPLPDDEIPARESRGEKEWGGYSQMMKFRPQNGEERRSGEAVSR